MAGHRTAQIPVFRWTLTLTDGTTLTTDALGYREDGPWTIFDDARGTTLSRRTDTITEVSRTPDPVSHQETDTI